MTDESTYTTRSTSSNSAEVTHVIPLVESKNGRARKVLVATIVRNAKAPDNRVKIDLIYERRSDPSADWQPADHLSLTKLRKGEWVRFPLDSAGTGELLTALRHLDAIAEHGPTYGETTWRVVGPDALVVTGTEGEALAELIKQHGRDALFELLSEVPNLPDFIAERRMQQRRRQAVANFERHLKALDWDEPAWQRFFMENDWMFGLGLTYHFLDPLHGSRPVYGGGDVSGTGNVEGDVLARTAGNTSFTALVELKLPSAPLVTNKKYRNQVNELGDDLVQGVAQIQAQCDEWGHAARAYANRDLIRRGILTTLPRGILLIGNSLELTDSDERALVFERYRRNLINPEVVTYDELLARAKFVVIGRAVEVSSST